MLAPRPDDCSLLPCLKTRASQRRLPPTICSASNPPSPPPSPPVLTEPPQPRKLCRGSRNNRPKSGKPQVKEEPASLTTASSYVGVCFGKGGGGLSVSVHFCDVLNSTGSQRASAQDRVLNIKVSFAPRPQAPQGAARRWRKSDGGLRSLAGFVMCSLEEKLRASDEGGR